MVDIDVSVGRYVAYSSLRYYDLTVITCPFLKYIETNKLMHMRNRYFLFILILNPLLFSGKHGWYGV